MNQRDVNAYIKNANNIAKTMEAFANDSKKVIEGALKSFTPEQTIRFNNILKETLPKVEGGVMDFKKVINDLEKNGI